MYIDCVTARLEWKSQKSPPILDFLSLRRKNIGMMVNLSNLTITIANSHHYSILNSVQKSPSSNSLRPACVSSFNVTGLTPPTTNMEPEKIGGVGRCFSLSKAIFFQVPAVCFRVRTTFHHLHPSAAPLLQGSHCPVLCIDRGQVQLHLASHVARLGWEEANQARDGDGKLWGEVKWSHPFGWVT